MDTGKNGVLSATRKRYPELSLLSVIFCILVVFIHCSAEPVTMLERASWQYAAVFLPWRLSAFVVQGFIMLSGIKLFAGKTEGVSYLKYMAKRIYTVWLPYAVWVLLFYLWFLHHGYFGFSGVDIVKYILEGNLVGHFYFVIAIMQFYLLFPLWKIIVKKVPAVAAICASLMIMIVLSQGLPSIIGTLFHGEIFAYNDRVFTTYLFYFVCGCYIGANYESFRESLAKYRMAVGAFFVIIATLNGLLSLSFFRGTSLLSSAVLDLMHTLYIVSAVFFFLMVSCAVCENRERLPRFLQSIDRASYIIYLSHPMFILYIDGYHLYKLESISQKYFIRLLFTYIACFGTCILYQSAKRGIIKYVKSRRKLKVQ